MPRWSRLQPGFRMLGIALTFVLALTFSRPALAALLVRISTDPPAPAAGERARVSVLTFVPVGQRCANDPAMPVTPIPRSQWRTLGADALDIKMVAVGPDGSSIDVPLAPRVSDPAYWDGPVVFPTPGRWTLRVIHPRWEDEECGGAKKSVTVLPAVLPRTGSGSGLGSAAPPLVAAGLICGAAAWALIRAQVPSGTDTRDRRY